VPGPDGPYDVTALSTSWAWAAGSLTSTPADLARFYRALVRGQLLPADLLAVMLDVSASHGAGYGLGIGQVELPCGRAYGHEGSVAGYWTLAHVSPDGDRSAVVAVTTGVMHTTPAQQQATLDALVSAFCGAGTTTRPAATALAVRPTDG
jgi:D-alanyl-D-alanine carboxypeptidase